jgi:MFS transporter, FHS family, glucose/mannose:H+ symporter
VDAGDRPNAAGPTPSSGVRLAAGIVACLTLLAVGWTGLLIPSLLRSIKSTFDQTDAGIGLVYLAYAVAYALGSFAGGPLTERAGRRLVLGAAVLTTAAGVAGLGLAPSWLAFVLASMAIGVGAGCLDGGANGLVLDVYREGRGRAMSLLHVSFSVGALAAPLIVGRLVEGGVSWQAVTVGSGVVIALLVLAYVLVPMPSARRAPHRADASVPGPVEARGSTRLLTGPLLLLGIAIAAYVAAEVGVSNWVVAFLEPAPLTTATLALSLYWAGLTVGRLVSSAISDRFDHLRFTIVCAVAMGAAIAIATLAPRLDLAIAAFFAAGVASGPVFPMIVAIGGERFPDRSAAVGGSLTGMAVIGSTIYPPAMGLLSVTVGLTVAMLGNAVLAVACVLALWAFSRATVPSSMPESHGPGYRMVRLAGEEGDEYTGE